VNLQQLERHPLFRLAVWKRNGWLLLVVALELLLLYGLACLRIDLAAGDEPAANTLRFLGYNVACH